VRLDVPVMIGVSALTLLLAWNGRVSRLEGGLLVVGLIAYVAWLIRLARGGRAEPGEGVVGRGDPLALQLVLIVAGLALLVLGSRFLVGGAVAIATTLGLSELIIGLTVVAAGTSLPEVASSVVAAIRGQRDIAVGNVVGSNIFNLLCVLGISAAVAPGGVPVASPALRFDLPVMIAVALACLPIFFTGHRIARWEGGLFLAYYVAYTLFLVLDAQQHDAAPLFGSFMLAFALPLTAVTLTVLAVRALRAPSRGAAD
jgi:cation:H+ antiporter